MPQVSTPLQWDNQFLSDLGIGSTNKAYQPDLNFLQHWQTRETGGGMPDKALYNLLATTQREPGSYAINSVGVQAFPSLQVGAQANASVLGGGGYPDLLSAFMSGNLDPNATYAGLSKWSGGGYSSLSGTGTGNPLTGIAQANQAGNQPQIDLLNQQNFLGAGQIALNQALGGQDISYAKQEEGFQEQLLGLSKEQLGNQYITLGRQLALDPKLFMLQQAALQDQAKMTHEQGWANIHSTVSQEAGSGSLFTKGGEQQRQLASDTMLSQERALSYAKAGDKLRYDETLAALHDQMKNIGILAKRYGISEQELQARLNNQLENINYQTQSGDLGVLGGMLSNDAQIAGLQQYALPPVPLYQGAGIPNSTVQSGTGQYPG